MDLAQHVCVGVRMNDVLYASFHRHLQHPCAVHVCGREDERLESRLMCIDAGIMRNMIMLQLAEGTPPCL